MKPAKRNYNQDWLPNLFNDFFENEWIPKVSSTVPSINVSEDDKAYTVEVAAPGMKKEDFKIYLSDNDNLVIAVEKKDEQEDKNKKYLRREFSYSKFEQALALPEDVDREKIAANVKHGVLTIELAKKEAIAKPDQPKMIEIL